MSACGPHAAEEPATAGLSAKEADAALILVHGRGGTAEGMLELAGEIAADGLVLIAPRAAGNTWYPQSFLRPIDENEPGLSSGLSVLSSAVETIESWGIPTDRQILLGFSQGACLTLEFAARYPSRYGAVVGLTGGLIGPPGTIRDYPGSLEGTPVFLGSSDPDPHVPWSRVTETGRVLEEMGAEVSLRRYQGMSHRINSDELDAVRTMIGGLVGLGRRSELGQEVAP